MFYENGLSINAAYAIDEPKKRAVGFKLSEGMGVPAELGSFKFARRKSKLAGTIRFNIKGEYWVDRARIRPLRPQSRLRRLNSTIPCSRAYDLGELWTKWLYAFEWGELVRILGGFGRDGQVTPPV